MSGLLNINERIHGVNVDAQTVPDILVVLKSHIKDGAALPPHTQYLYGVTQNVESAITKSLQTTFGNIHKVDGVVALRYSAALGFLKQLVQKNHIGQIYGVALLAFCGRYIAPQLPKWVYSTEKNT